MGVVLDFSVLRCVLVQRDEYLSTEDLDVLHEAGKEYDEVE